MSDKQRDVDRARDEAAVLRTELFKLKAAAGKMTVKRTGGEVSEVLQQSSVLQSCCYWMPTLLAADKLVFAFKAARVPISVQLNLDSKQIASVALTSSYKVLTCVLPIYTVCVEDLFCTLPVCSCSLWR